MNTSQLHENLRLPLTLTDYEAGFEVELNCMGTSAKVFGESVVWMVSGDERTTV